MNWNERLVRTEGHDSIGFTCRVKDLLGLVAGAAKPLNKLVKDKVDPSVAMMVSVFDDGVVLCRGSDGEREMAFVGAAGMAAVSKAGSVLVAGHMFRDFLRKLSSDSDVTISTGSGDSPKIRVTSGRSKIELVSVGRSADFRAIEEPSGAKVAIQGVGLGRACACVAHAMSGDVSRYYLCGIYVHPNTAGGLSFVATDGHRLSKFDWTCDMAGEFSPCIVPSATVPMISDVVGKTREDGVVIVSSDSRSVQFVTDGAMLRSRLVDGDYPKYLAIFPTDESIQTVVKLSVSKLLDSVDKVQSILEEKNASVNIHVTDAGNLGLSAGASGVRHHAEDVVDIDAMEGVSDRRYSFNARYMGEFLKTLNQNGTVSIRMAGDTAATSWRHDEEPGRDYLLMPVRG